MKKIIYIVIAIGALILITGVFDGSPSSNKKDPPEVSDSIQFDDILNGDQTLEVDPPESDVEFETGITDIG